MTGSERCRRKFLRIFPDGFHDADYVSLERDYKWAAHRAWREALSEPKLMALLEARAYHEIALTAVRIEARTNLLFSFEKMALRDAVKSAQGAAAFARGLRDCFTVSHRWPNVLPAGVKRSKRCRAAKPGC